MKKKILSMAIVVCMLISMMPTMVFAAEEIPYLDENGTEQTCASAKEVTAEDTMWTAGWYIAQGEVTLARRVEVQGDVYLILADGAKLIAPFFIFVPPLRNNFEKIQNIQDFICCISCFSL